MSLSLLESFPDLFPRNQKKAILFSTRFREDFNKLRSAHSFLKKTSPYKELTIIMGSNRIFIGFIFEWKIHETPLKFYRNPVMMAVGQSSRVARFMGTEFTKQFHEILPISELIGGS